MRRKHIATVLAVASILCACASSGRSAGVSTVPTTSAAAPAQCRNANSNCWMDYECCSQNCDYDQHFCR